MFQDPKYAIFAVNRATGRVIPPHVPLMLFVGHDAIAAAGAIAPYIEKSRAVGVKPEQIVSAEERLQTFTEFAADHPDEMKLPGSPSRAAPQMPEFPVAIDGHYTYWLSGGNVVQFVKPVEAEDDEVALLPGTTNEEVLAMLIDRITRQQAVSSQIENESILVHLNTALNLQRMGVERRARTAAPAPACVSGMVQHGIVMVDCDSSNLEAYGYDAATERLALRFRSKGADQPARVYHYREVPQSVYQGLLDATSKGGYVARFITSKFEGAAMPEEAAQPA